ncbi:hypothetical protein Pint_33102 [Pistacia integerrima]|uniref:Uncharacterized protein n=1 Tax=Pistacia integerrima TaxID=434235 RepID=A0ACC0X741_9ROSI|nr:hypothetical protein Pint_33102 [Pistacia integerrima]
MVKKYKKSYNYLRIELVQIGIKPLSIEGLDTAIFACLRDCRWLRLRDSLLGTIESRLSNGPIFFNCYLGFIVCLDDQNVLDVLTLNIKTFNYDLKPGTIPIATIYKIQYKVMQSAFETRAINHDQKGHIVLFQTDLTRSNIIVPKTINWDQIALPEDWGLANAVIPLEMRIPKPLTQPIQNTEIENITEN